MIIWRIYWFSINEIHQKGTERWCSGMVRMWLISRQCFPFTATITIWGGNARHKWRSTLCSNHNFSYARAFIYEHTTLNLNKTMIFLKASKQINNTQRNGNKIAIIFNRWKHTHKHKSFWIGPCGCESFLFFCTCARWFQCYALFLCVFLSSNVLRVYDLALGFCLLKIVYLLCVCVSRGQLCMF